MNNQMYDSTMIIDGKDCAGINPLIMNKVILNQIEKVDQEMAFETFNLENKEGVVAIFQNQFMKILVNENVNCKKDVTTCLEMIKIVLKGL